MMDPLPHWSLMEEFDPILLAKMQPWREHLFQEGILPRKTKELILTAMCAQARFLPGVAIHSEHALDAGATAQELYELCALGLLIGGVPSYRESVLTVAEVVRERGATT
jgi:alkylhydroperoxidase/carboxymuconolactone decarboxylase family protein YurZ